MNFLQQFSWHNISSTLQTILLDYLQSFLMQLNESDILTSENLTLRLMIKVISDKKVFSSTTLTAVIQLLRERPLLDDQNQFQAYISSQ